jgi:uncharacterized protein (DUF885 family)
MIRPVMKISLAIALFSFALSCTNQAEKKAAGMDPEFERYKNNFVEALWKIYPEWASSQGYHKYDSILVVPDAATREREIAFMNANLDSLKQFDPARLDNNNKTDYYMIESQLNGTVWALTVEKPYAWNPAQYNVCGSFAEMLNNNYDSLDVRLHNFFLKMGNIPAFYEAAKMNISNPTLEHTQLAIDQNLGGSTVFEADLKNALAKSALDDSEKKEILERGAASAKAIRDFANWLKQLKNETPRSFRLGSELYAKKFEYNIQSGYTPEQIYGKALAHKRELHQKMFALAGQLWSKYLGAQEKPSDSLQLIRQVIDKISLDHVHPDSFQAAIEQQMPILVEFIRKKNLINIDPSKPLVVRREPDYMAGVAGASISAPGPYDKNGNTYYNVGSLSGWDKDRAESYLREYNKYILQILNIHEAIPGHYTQLVYSNQSPSLIKSLFGSSSMVEGWAVYAERMMLENGYGGDEPEMWLMYYKWNMRSTCNTILDYSVHTRNMSREDALSLLMNEAFQQKTEAENKWRRVSVTQVQLCCYFTGYTEIYDFREEMKRKLGDKFDLKAFHEKFLSYGSAPVKYIRELMLADLDSQKK